MMITKHVNPASQIESGCFATATVLTSKFRAVHFSMGDAGGRQDGTPLELVKIDWFQSLHLHRGRLGCCLHSSAQNAFIFVGQY